MKRLVVNIVEILIGLLLCSWNKDALAEANAGQARKGN